MLQLTSKLCKFNTGVISDDNERLFDLINSIIPLNYYKYKSGEEFNGWLVPKTGELKKLKYLKMEMKFLMVFLIH